MRISVTQLRSLILAINLVLAGGLVYKALAAYDVIALAFGEVIVESHPARVDLKKFLYTPDAYGRGPDPTSAVIRVSSDLQPQKAALPTADATTVADEAEDEDEDETSTPEELPEGPLAEKWEYVYYIAWQGDSGVRNFAQIRKKQDAKTKSSSRLRNQSSISSRRNSTTKRRVVTSRSRSSKYKKKAEALSFLVSDRRIQNEEFELDFWVHSADKDRLVYWMPGRPGKRYALSYTHEGSYLAQGPMRTQLRPEDDGEEDDDDEKKKSFYIIQEDANPEEAREKRYELIIAGKTSESKFSSTRGKSSRAGSISKTSAGSWARTSSKPTKPTAKDIRELKNAINKIPKKKQAELKKELDSMLRGKK